MGAPVGRTNADKDTSLGAVPLQMMRTQGAGVYLNRDNVGIAPRQQVDFGNKPWRNLIADEIGETLFKHERIVRQRGKSSCRNYCLDRK